MTKYARQLKNARATIIRKGTVCTWFKASDTDTSNDTSPEFPSDEADVQYPDTPIVFYPLKRQNLVTDLAIALTGSFEQQIFGMIPGDVPFIPVIGDKVSWLMGDGVTTQILHVSYVNITQPDMTPIVYELGFK